MNEPTSKEAKFLYELFSVQELPKHPLVAILFGQLQKLTSLIDSNPEYQEKVRSILNYVKEEWNG